MPWTTPKTWATGELVTATDLNLHVRDNLDALKSPPTATARISPGGTIQITSTTFVDIHSSLNFNLTTAGGALLLGLTARIYHNPGTNMDCYFDANINGTSQGGSNGIYWVLAPNSYQFTFSTTWLTQPLAAGAQTVKIQCKRGGNNSNPVQIWDVFAWVQEVS